MFATLRKSRQLFGTLIDGWIQFLLQSHWRSEITGCNVHGVGGARCHVTAKSKVLQGLRRSQGGESGTGPDT